MANDVRDIQIRDARVEDAELLAEAQRVIARVPGRLAATPSELKDEVFRERIVRLGNSECGKFVCTRARASCVRDGGLAE